MFFGMRLQTRVDGLLRSLPTMFIKIIQKRLKLARLREVLFSISMSNTMGAVK